MFVRATRCFYIGQTTNLQARLRQHRARPPRRLAKDLEEGVPFDAQVSCVLLDWAALKPEADRKESDLIAIIGHYNDLCGTPTHSGKRAWAIINAKRRCR